MQVTTNEKLIRRRSKLGTYASLGGLGVLVAGFVASFQQNLIWVSLIAIVLGFILDNTATTVCAAGGARRGPTRSSRPR